MSAMQAQHLGLRHEDHEFKMFHPQETMMSQNRGEMERKGGKERCKQNQEGMMEVGEG